VAKRDGLGPRALFCNKPRGTWHDWGGYTLPGDNPSPTNQRGYESEEILEGTGKRRETTDSKERESLGGRRA